MAQLLALPQAHDAEKSQTSSGLAAQRRQEGGWVVVEGSWGGRGGGERGGESLFYATVNYAAANNGARGRVCADTTGNR